MSYHSLRATVNDVKRLKEPSLPPDLRVWSLRTETCAALRDSLSFVSQFESLSLMKTRELKEQGRQIYGRRTYRQTDEETDKQTDRV